jgi:small subunit ribosomal protein S3
LGHKVHPIGFRIGVIKDWQSKWYSEAHYAEFVQEDNRLRKTIMSKYPDAAISLIEIDRQAKDVTITLHTARPGIVIGRGGQRVDEMRQFLEGLIGKKIRLNIQEIRQPELDAYLVARSVAEQIERRVAYRRAMKQAIFRTIQSGAKGIKVSAAGRLANAEIARRQTLHEGQVPLHTLRADVDYGFAEAHTTLGRIGVKVWIYKGQVLPELKITEAEAMPAEAEAEAEIAEAPATEEKPAEVEEKPTEAAEKEVAEAEEKPAKPAKTTKKAPAKAEEKPVEIEEKPAEAAGKEVAEAKEKPAKPVKTTKKAPAKAEEKPAKPKAKKTVKKAAAKEPAAEVAKTKATKTKAAKTKAEKPKKEVKAEKAKTEKAPRKSAAVKKEKATPKKTKTVAKSKKEAKDAAA